MASIPKSNDVDDIRRQMARIRHEIHEDVQDVVASAEVVTDWRHYVRLYPVAACAVAVAVGYFIVPKKRKIVVETPPEVREALKADKPKRAGIIGAVTAAAGTLALRAAQAYAANFVEQWLAGQQAAGPGAPQAAPQGPWSPGSPGGSGPA